MSKKKKSRSGRRRPGARNGTVSKTQFTPTQYPCQSIVADLLGTGEENAVPLAHLEMLTGLDGRTVRKQIERERRQGIPILSKNGYYLPADERERAAWIASMRRRAGEILRTAKAVEREGRK